MWFKDSKTNSEVFELKKEFLQNNDNKYVYRSKHFFFIINFAVKKKLKIIMFDFR